MPRMTFGCSCRGQSSRHSLYRADTITDAEMPSRRRKVRRKKSKIELVRSGIIEDGDKPVDATYKILLLGESGVGKTSLIKAIMGNDFQTSLVPTIGIDFVKRTFLIDGARIQLEIWDSAGQERFRSLTRFQFRGVQGVLLIYDVTSTETFEVLNYWLDTIDKDIDGSNVEPVPVFIIGNKADLQNERQVSTEEGKKLSEESYVHGFVETSAKENRNITQAFWKLAFACAEIYTPKLLNCYLSPDEKQEKIDNPPPPPEPVKKSSKGFKLSFKSRPKLNCCAK